MNGKRIIEYDIVRAYTLLLVLLGHSLYNTISTDYGGIDIGLDAGMNCLTEKGLLFLFRIFDNFKMPLFVALSGSLWAVHIRKKGLPEFGQFWKGKARRLLLPFLIAALFWSIPLKYISGYWAGAGENTLSQIFVGQILMFGNANSHLWFVQMLFWVFLMSYAVERYGLRRNVRLFAVSLFAVSLCSRWVTETFHVGLLNMLPALYYLLWFYLGFYFEQYRGRVNEYISQHVSWTEVIAGCIVYLAAGFAADRIHIRGFGGLVSSYFLALMGMALIYAFCYKSLIITPPRMQSIINRLSADSYGLYLYSDPVNYVILWAINAFSLQWIYGDNLGSLSIFLIRFLATTFAAWAVIKVSARVGRWLRARCPGPSHLTENL